MYFTPVYIKVLILHTNADNNVFFIMASCWLLWQPQIREYYNWSLKCNYAGRGTELYNIAIHPNDYVTLFVLKSPCYICFLVQIYFDFKSVYFIPVYIMVFILHTNTDNNGFFLMSFRVNSESAFFFKLRYTPMNI